MPLISILMPVYNAQKYLAVAIESILQQTFTDFELIIIDDGSTDQTIKLINKFNDSRIKVIHHHHNRGVVYRLNEGLQLAQGEFIARQDADDVSAVDRFFKQIKLFNEQPQLGLVGSFYWLINEAGDNLRIRSVATQHDEIQLQLLQENQFCHGSVMFRRSCVCSVGGYRDLARHVEDYDLWLRIANRWKVCNIAEPLYSLRIHRQSVSAQFIYDQQCFAVLISSLARSRRLDDLEKMNLKEMKAQITALMPEHKLKRHQLTSRYCYSMAEILYVAHSFKEAGLWIVDAIRHHFNDRNNWILLSKIILKSLVGVR